MGGTKCAGLVLSRSGDVLAEDRVRSPDTAKLSTADAVTALLATFEGLVRALQTALDHARVGELIDAVGVGVPGLVNAAGELQFAPHLPGVVDLGLRAALEERLGLPVRLDNDNTAAARAEAALGAGVGAHDMLYVGLGTGIGGAFFSDGRLVGGGSGFAGELGHVSVDPIGRSCVCGRRGCWETVASGNALARIGADYGVVTGVDPDGEPSATGVVVRARSGNLEALAAVDAWTRHLADGLVNLVLTLDPDRVVLGGGVILDAAPLVLPRLASRMEAMLGRAKGHRRLPPVHVARLGVRAGSIGAAVLARDA
jgi:glucokinase